MSKLYKVTFIGGITKTYDYDAMRSVSDNAINSQIPGIVSFGDTSDPFRMINLNNVLEISSIDEPQDEAVIHPPTAEELRGRGERQRIESISSIDRVLQKARDNEVS